MASEVLISISRDEIERARLMSEYKYQVDTQSHIVTARWEGERKGRREGERKGRAEGRQEGRAEGRQEGRAEGKIEIARALKGMGDSVEKIQAATGLSVETIEKL